MGILDRLRKDADMVERSKNLSLEELFESFDMTDEDSDEGLLGDLAKNLMKAEVVDNDRDIFQGDNLNKILRDVSKRFNMDEKTMQYEILERPKKNIFGLSKGTFTIRVHNLPESEEGKKTGRFEKDYWDLEDLKNIKKENLYDTGIEVSITPLAGVVLRKTGAKIDESRAIAYIKNRYGGFFDDRMFFSFVQAEDKELRLSEYRGNIESDYGVMLSRSEDDAMAYIELSAPKIDGADIEKGDIEAFLKDEGIKEEYFKEGTIRELEEKRVYGKKILVAEGILAKHGKNAEIIFDVNMDEAVDFENDRIDFKSLNPVINVEKGQLIAHKGESIQGVDGVNVFGEKIVARQSGDVDLSKLLGDKIEIKDDGKSLYAMESGQLIKGKKGEFSIREVMLINGDVGPKTGNIDFIGSVEVKGSILAGYSVKVGGNLSVNDSIETCNIDVTGALVVKLGINGKSDGIIKCRTLYSKFVQDTEAHVQEGVYVEEGIIRSKIYSNGNVVVNGKRANIISSTVYAKNEINAKSIGSSNEAKVFVKVGYPGITRLEYEVFSNETASLVTEVAKLVVEIASIEKKGPSYIKKFQEKYDAFIEERNEKEPKLSEYEAKKQELLDKIKEEKNLDGFIAVSDTIYVGASVTCCDAEFEVKIEDRALKYTVNKENPKFIFVSRNIRERSKIKGEK